MASEGDEQTAEIKTRPCKPSKDTKEPIRRRIIFQLPTGGNKDEAGICKPLGSLETSSVKTSLPASSAIMTSSGIKVNNATDVKSAAGKKGDKMSEFTFSALQKRAEMVDCSLRDLQKQYNSSPTKKKSIQTGIQEALCKVAKLEDSLKEYPC